MTTLPTTSPPPITAEEAREIALAGLFHLERLILPDGRFVYAHQAGDIDARHDGYNLLRHCGTAWFMIRAVNLLVPEPPPALAPALARAIGFIGARLQPAPWAAPDRPSLGLVSNGAVKLGGLGLALLMLAEATHWPALAALLPLPCPTRPPKPSPACASMPLTKSMATTSATSATSPPAPSCPSARATIPARRSSASSPRARPRPTCPASPPP